MPQNAERDYWVVALEKLGKTKCKGCGKFVQVEKEQVLEAK